MIPGQVFRSNTNLFVGLFSVVFFQAIFGVTPAYHLITHTPWYETSRHGTTIRPASDGEMYMILASGWFFTLLGLWLILSWKNEVVEVDSDGIVARNSLGLEKFRAEWPLVDRVAIRRGRKGAVIFDVYSGENKMSFPGMITKRPELVEIIRTQATHADFSSWASF